MEETNVTGKHIEGVKRKEIKLIYLIIGTIIIAIAFMGVMIKMIIENSECVDNPFQYSAIKLKESGGDYSCSCSSNNASLLDFSFNGTGITIINPNELGEINYSNIKIIGEKGGN